MFITCLDLEGVLVPEIWIAFAEASGIPELRRTTRDELERGGLHVDAAAGHCDSVRLGLLADVDHMGLTGLVKVCQFAHFRYL